MQALCAECARAGFVRFMGGDWGAVGADIAARNDKLLAAGHGVLVGKYRAEGEKVAFYAICDPSQSRVTLRMNLDLSDDEGGCPPRC